MAFTSKDSLIKALKTQLATTDRQAIKGLITIYNYQTSEEQCEGYTKEYNGVGFSSIDSDLLSSFAEQYIKKRMAFRKTVVLREKAHAQICKTVNQSLHCLW